MKNKNKIWAVVIGIIAITAVITTQPFWSRDYAMAVSAHPEPFTELYFNNISSLPSTVQAGRPVILHFTIANHEGAQEIYQYRITQIKNGKTTSKFGSVNLLSDQSVRLPVTIAPTKTGEAIEIIIELPNKHQNLRFRTKS